MFQLLIIREGSQWAFIFWWHSRVSRLLMFWMCPHMVCHVILTNILSTPNNLKYDDKASEERGGNLKSEKYFDITSFLPRLHLFLFIPAVAGLRRNLNLIFKAGLNYLIIPQCSRFNLHKSFSPFTVQFSIAKWYFLLWHKIWFIIDCHWYLHWMSQRSFTVTSLNSFLHSGHIWRCLSWGQKELC